MATATLLVPGSCQTPLPHSNQSPMRCNILVSLQQPYNCRRVQVVKPAKGKRKAPEPAEEDESEDDDLSSEDEPLPGEEDADDSNDSDKDVLEHGEGEGPADELAVRETSVATAGVRIGAVSGTDGRPPASTKQAGRRQQIPVAADDRETDSEDDADEGTLLCFDHPSACFSISFFQSSLLPLDRHRLPVGSEGPDETFCIYSRLFADEKLDDVEDGEDEEDTLAEATAQRQQSHSQVRLGFHIFRRLSHKSPQLKICNCRRDWSISQMSSMQL